MSINSITVGLTWWSYKLKLSTSPLAYHHVLLKWNCLLRHASQTKIKQYMSSTDHLLLTSSQYVLKCHSHFLKWRGHVHNSSQYRSFQPNKHILNISISRYCTRIKDPTINKKPFLPWDSLIFPVTHKPFFIVIT